ncbi:MAG: hypothetical protein ACLQFR_21260 [Streptosporangiaceae bacterium]
MRPDSDRRWLSTVLLACLVAGAVFAVLHQSAPHAKPPAPSPSRPPPPALKITHVGHPLLGVTADWELFGLAADSVVAIQLNVGQITRTFLPPQEGSGPVSFIVGPHQAIIRPLDNVPGYLVPDGRPARALTGILARGALLLPGPNPAQQWVVSNRGGSTLPLVADDGRVTGVQVTLPRHWAVQSAMADGRGELLLFDDHGQQFDVGPRWLRRVGALVVAIGPARWLGLACHQGHCRNVVIDVATGTRRVLPGPPVNIVNWPWPSQPGVVAPDGSTAAVIEAGRYGHVLLKFIDLGSGAVTAVAAPVTEATSSQMLAWSPDSRWLFVAGRGGKLVAVNAVSHHVDSLGIPLPGLSQIAVR